MSAPSIQKVKKRSCPWSEFLIWRVHGDAAHTFQTCQMSNWRVLHCLQIFFTVIYVCKLQQRKKVNWNNRIFSVKFNLCFGFFYIPDHNKWSFMFLSNKVCIQLTLSRAVMPMRHHIFNIPRCWHLSQKSCIKFLLKLLACKLYLLF